MAQSKSQKAEARGAGVTSQLRGLWREIDALGGTHSNDYDAGYCQGIDQASLILEAAGFEENKSTAADLIDALVKALEKAEELYQAGLIYAPDGLAQEVVDLRRAALLSARGVQ